MHRKITNVLSVSEELSTHNEVLLYHNNLLSFKDQPY